MMQSQSFDTLARSRRAVRSFKSDPLPPGLLDEVLDTTRWAPSGYNLQPTHFLVVDNPALRPALKLACMGQRQLEQAPATVIFLGDRRVADNHLALTLQHEEENGSLHPKSRAATEKFVPLAFNTSPLGVGWLVKAALPHVRRLTKPTPELPAVHRRYWLAKQVSLSVMTFMLAASAAGLGTCPMEGFDESRIKKILKIPRHMVVVMVVPVGFSADAPTKRSRLPLERILHRNGW